MLYDYIFKNWDPNCKSQVTQNANTIVMCILMGDSPAGKWKPQSAFLAICPSLNIPFRDNRQKCRHEALSLIHCTGRSEFLKHLHDWVTLRTLCHSYGMVKRSQVEVTFLVLSPSYCTQLNQSSLSFQKLWQEDKNAYALRHGKVKVHTYLTESCSAVCEEAWPGFHFTLPTNRTEFLDSY